MSRVLHVSVCNTIVVFRRELRKSSFKVTIISFRVPSNQDIIYQDTTFKQPT
jgi:hypothetical protein